MSAKKLAQIRDKIASLIDERDAIEGAPVPRGEAEARLDHVIARVREDWANGSLPPDLTNGRVSEREVAEWLGRASPFNGVVVGGGGGSAALCAMFPDVIKATLLTAYDQQVGDNPQGLPAVERRKKLTALAAEIYALEVEEEHVIEALEEQGHDIARRPNADAFAALGLAPRGEAA